MASSAAPTMHAQLAAGRQARAKGEHDVALALFVDASLAQPDHPGPQLEIAESQRRLGRFDLAEQGFRAVLARQPGRLEAQLGLGRCALARGDEAAALGWFGSAATGASGNAWAQLELAAVQRRVGHLADAEASYARAHALNPDLTQPLVGLAACARQRRDRAAALGYSEAACRAAPEQLQLQVERAEDLRELDRVEEAGDVLAAVLAREPTHYTALLGAAALARRQGQHRRALGLLEQAQAAAGERAYPTLTMIAIERELGELDEARARATALLARQPENAAARVQLGLVERLAGNHSAALAEFEAAHALDPRFIEAMLQMAIEHRTLGDQAACDALLDRAVACDQTGTQALHEAGRQAIMANDYASALTFFERGIATGRAHHSLYAAAAEALARLGRTDEAMALLERAEALPGYQIPMLVKRTTLLRQLGHYAQAMVHARAAAAAAPQVFAVQMELFRLQSLIGSEAEIAASLAAMTPNTGFEHCQVASFRGVVAEDAGDVDQAMGHYRHALALRPTDSSLHQSMARASILALDFAAAAQYLRQHVVLVAPANRLQRRSLNPSQTAFGQMIDEYRLDGQVLAAVAALLPMPPLDQVAALLGLVRRFGDSTLIAVGLVTALWRGGVLDRGGPAAEAAIPRRIVQFWDMTEPPAEVAEIMASCAARNPGYFYARFDDETAQQFLAEHYPRAVLLAYERSRQPAQRSDLFRLAYLALLGGIYIDADDRCNASLEALLPDHAGLVVYREEVGTLGNNFIAAVAGHPVIVAALDQAVTAINRGDGDTLWFLTGPGLMTRAFAQVMAAAGDADGFVGGVRIWQRREMYRVIAMHCVTAYKKTKLHWQNTAFGKSGSPGALPPVLEQKGPC